MIVYEGPSMIDPSVEIAAIITGTHDPSSNAKTGRLAQLWIMRTDVQHGKTLKDNLDRAVCGACPFAGGQGCYVTPMATASIFKTYKAGNYGPVVSAVDAVSSLKLQMRRRVIDGLRVGAYGDPVAVPLELMERLVLPLREEQAVVTGYTHAWRAEYRTPTQPEPDPGWKKLVMASCHHSRDVSAAQEAGWRVFAALGRPEKKEGSFEAAQASVRRLGLALCPASTERPEQIRLTCAQCGGCDGRKGTDDRRVGFGILIHGSAVVLNAARCTTRKLENTQ